MRVTEFSWLGKEFIALSAEAPGASPGEAARALLSRFDQELNQRGLSLDHTVRSRLWGRDRAARDAGSRERVAVLAGRARSSSASFISPTHFDSEAMVALDLLAVRPGSRREKRLQEYEPAIVPLRYLVWDGVVFLSGVTCDEGSLAEQVETIIPRIGESLTHAGASWRNAVRMSCFLHRGQKASDLRTLLVALLGDPIPGAQEYSLVDGYSTPGKLIEIEVTAAL